MTHPHQNRRTRFLAVAASAALLLGLTPTLQASAADPVNLDATIEDVPVSGSTPPGATVTDLFEGKFDDLADTSIETSADTFAGIAITTNAATAAQGTWQYSEYLEATPDVRNWTPLPVDVTSANAFLLQPNDSLRFVPAGNFNGVPGELTVRLIDSSVTVTTAARPDLSNDTTKSGGSTGYSDSSNAITLSTSVEADNDAPIASGSITLTPIAEQTPPTDTGANLLSTFVAASNAYSDSTDTITTAVSGGSTGTLFAGAAVIGNSADPTT